MRQQLPSMVLLPVVALLCLAATDALAETMYWTDRGSGKIQRTVAGHGVEDLVQENVFEPVSIALDHLDGRMYWTDATPADFMISRANLDGTDAQLLQISGGEVSGLAVDVSGRKLYWTDVGWGRISRVSLDGSGVEDLVSDLTLDPIEIALDVPAGKMYWTASTPTGGRISRSNLDGTAVEDIVTGLLDPSGIALDLVHGNVYWTDIGTGKIQRADLDGNGIQDVLSESVESPVRIALDVPAGKIYWTEGSPADFMISRASLDGSDVEFLVTGLIRPSGIALVPGATTSVGHDAVGVSRIRLSSAPNPFRSGVHLSGSVPLERDLTGRIIVFDVAGRIVHRSDVEIVRGQVDYLWNGARDSGTRVPAGVYRVLLRAGDLSASTSVVLVE